MKKLRPEKPRQKKKKLVICIVSENFKASLDSEPANLLQHDAVMREDRTECKADTGGLPKQEGHHASRLGELTGAITSILLKPLKTKE